jgi:hypothetical protein
VRAKKGYESGRQEFCHFVGEGQRRNPAAPAPGDDEFATDFGAASGSDGSARRRNGFLSLALISHSNLGPRTALLIERERSIIGPCQRFSCVCTQIYISMYTCKWRAEMLNGPHPAARTWPQHTARINRALQRFAHDDVRVAQLNSS